MTIRSSVRHMLQHSYETSTLRINFQNMFQDSTPRSQRASRQLSKSSNRTSSQQRSFQQSPKSHGSSRGRAMALPEIFTFESPNTKGLLSAITVRIDAKDCFHSLISEVFDSIKGGRLDRGLDYISYSTESSYLSELRSCTSFILPYTYVPRPHHRTNSNFKEDLQKLLSK